MKKSIISNLFITVLFIVPLLIKTLGVNTVFVNSLVDSLRAILIFLIVFNLIGLICLQTVSKFAKYIDTKDLLEENKNQEKLENNNIYKAYRIISLSLFFGLLMYNRLYLTTIFACIWWLSKHIFKIYFDKFMKDLD